MEFSVQNLKKVPASKKILQNLPEAAGVYIFYLENRPIYIGKAVNLKSRVSSYFGVNLAPKTAKMVSEAEELGFIKVTSEIDSLLLEAKLVHDLKPRYNATLKDDKHPLYIRITKEKYPRIVTARKIEEKEPNLAFYGPFPSSWAVRSVLRMLRRIFPYSEHKLGRRPCLYSHIGLCEPCPSFIEKLKTKNEIDVYYPFRSLFTGRRQEELEFGVARLQTPERSDGGQGKSTDLKMPCKNGIK